MEKAGSTGHLPADCGALSRVLSHALRHEPWLYELELDDEGRTSVDDVLAALRNERQEWNDLTEDDLGRLIETSSKRRHELKDGQIRALYGHSIAGKLKRTPAIPPAILFHGTSPSLVPQVQSSGLRPMGRQHVHLSTDEGTAIEVGKRKAKNPIILQVLAKEAHDSGVVFYEGNDKVWLADNIPPQFIDFKG